MNKRFRKYPFFILLLLLTLLQQSASGTSITDPPALLPYKIGEGLRTYVNRAKPFIKGAVPKETYDYLFKIAPRIPVSGNLSVRSININKLLTNVYPHLPKNITINGTADFALTVKKPKPNVVSLKLRILSHSPKTYSSFIFQANMIEFLCRVTLHLRSHTASGSITCIITSSSLYLPEPFKSWIDISKLTMDGIIKNRGYILKGKMYGIHSKEIRLGRYPLHELTMQYLSLKPDELFIRSLKAQYQSQTLTLNESHLNFSSMLLYTKGALLLDTRGPFSFKGAIIKEIQGPVSFKLRGSIQAPHISLSGKVRAAKITVLTHKAPIEISGIKGSINLENNQLLIPSLHFSLNHAVTCNTALSTDSISHPSSRLKWAVSASVANIHALNSLMKDLIPNLTLPSEASGTLYFEANGEKTNMNLFTEGRVVLKGNILNTSPSMLLKGVALSLPFDLRLSLSGSNMTTQKKLPTFMEKSGTLQIKSARFGMIALQNLSCHIQTIKNRLTLNKATCDIFQGLASGEGFIRLLSPFPWNLKLNINRVSLNDICGHIPGLQNALGGKVNARLTLAGNGVKIPSMHGVFKAETIKTQEEPTRISQDFIRKLTGKKGRLFFYRKYRPYNKGIIEANIRDGIITFKSLEISHSLFGFKDLSISVSRLSNKISIKDLIWEILQAPNRNSVKPIVKTR